MNPTILAIVNSQFVQLALPIMITILIASWNSNRRVDDIIRRLAAIELRLLGLENKFATLDKSVSTLQVRAWK